MPCTTAYSRAHDAQRNAVGGSPISDTADLHAGHTTSSQPFITNVITISGAPWVLRCRCGSMLCRRPASRHVLVRQAACESSPFPLPRDDEPAARGGGGRGEGIPP